MFLIAAIELKMYQQYFFKAPQDHNSFLAEQLASKTNVVILNPDSSLKLTTVRDALHAH